MSTIEKRIHLIQERIVQTAKRYHRNPNEIQLIAVSKGHGANVIREAFDAGLRDFAENYWQEAESKMALLEDLSLHWHFTGALQSNKASLIAKHFSWVHTLSTQKAAELLSRHRPVHLAPLNVCLQVNLDHESSKTGCLAEDVLLLSAFVSKLPNLRLRGLMSIPKPMANDTLNYESLMRLTQLLHICNQKLNLSMDTLSMGMSADMISAIRAGSTMVRIGRAIFGERER